MLTCVAHLRMKVATGSVCLLVIMLFATLGGGKKQKKLDIISEVGHQPFNNHDTIYIVYTVSFLCQHIPEECSSQAAQGDALTVHYTV